ncbi:MAG: hypothetical protein D6690_02305 [Nitrospirae bacterium]|nr:MAG: hypothetical protein D6690_02305 [Nitrospirota bacterium]
MIRPKLPRIRRPALYRGRLMYFDFARLLGHRTVLCLLRRIRLHEAIFLHRQALWFAEHHITLAAITSDENPFRDSWVSTLPALDIPLIADPLGLAHRRLGIPLSMPHDKVQSILFDHHGTLQRYVIHELNGRGMRFLLDLIMDGRRDTDLGTSPASSSFAQQIVCSSSHYPSARTQDGHCHVDPCRVSEP